MFHKVYLNLNDNEYYVEDNLSRFDDLWTSLNRKGVVGKILYKIWFYVIVWVARITGKCKKAYIDFD